MGSNTLVSGVKTGNTVQIQTLCYLTERMQDPIVILTGAGISAESGIDTFRSAGGIWSQYDIEDVATPQGFARNPELVYEFYNMRRANLAKVTPNAAHIALAKLEAARNSLIITQNVDNLHEQGGANRVIHMHGSHVTALCASCQHRWPAAAKMTAADACPSCKANTVRPDVVWFGEMPYHMDRINDALTACATFVSIGTSGNVYPAASFAAQAKANGAYCLELNLEPSKISPQFDETRHGPATKLVPAWVKELCNA
jgi:NAD-dependent deacetylase